jgi:hypothetical protein
MPAVPRQDLPKIVAVVAGILVAVSFLVFNIVRMRGGGHGGTASIPPQPNTGATSSVVAGGPVGAPEGPLASVPGRAASTRPDWGWPPASRVHDPFRPLAAGIAPMEKSGHVEIRPTTAPVLPALGPAASPIANSIERAIPETPSSPTGASATRPPVAATPITLAGTVGDGSSGVAAFRVGSTVVPVSAAGTIAGWRVLRIDGAQVWIARNADQRCLRLGDDLPRAP